MSAELSILAFRKRVRRIANLVLKEFDTMSKDPISIGVLFVLPIIIIYIAAVAELGEGEALKVWIVDYDDTELSHDLIDVFKDAKANSTGKSTFEIQDNHELGISASEFEITAFRTVPTADLAAYIILHEGFQEEIKESGRTILEIYVDGLDSFTMLSVEGQIDGTLIQFQLRQGVFFEQVFYFPQFVPDMPDDILSSGAPSIIAFSLWASMCLICTQAVVGDIPLKRILVAPTRKYEVIISKTIAYSVLAFFQGLLSLFLIEFLFNVPFIGIFIDIFVAVFLLEICGVTCGIFFSTISTSRLQAAQLFLFYFIMAMLIQMSLRFPFILPFLPAEQSQTLIINLAYRGQSIFDNLDRIFNLMLSLVTFFLLSIFWFSFRRKEI